MSDSNNALAVLDEIRGSVPAVNDETFNGIVGDQNNYSSRLQLFSFNSGAVKEDKIKAGRFAIVNGSDLDDCTDEIVILPVAIRCKAMDLGGDKPVIAYDQNSPLFADIRSRSTEKESNCMCGVEFLVYVPDKDSFTTFYLANKTLLREASNVKANLGFPIKCKSKLIKKGTMSWHGMTVAAFPAEVKVPPRDRFLSEIEMFNNAKDSVVD